MEATVYQTQHKIRIVTAASLFDGHDAAINIMHQDPTEIRRRNYPPRTQPLCLRNSRCSHTGRCPGHSHHLLSGRPQWIFKYIYDLCKKEDVGIFAFWWGQGYHTFPQKLKTYTNTASPEFYSRTMVGIWVFKAWSMTFYRNVILPLANYSMEKFQSLPACQKQPSRAWFLRLKTHPEENKAIIETIAGTAANAQVPGPGITGTGGSGKSSMVDEIVRRFIIDFTDKNCNCIRRSIQRKTGGALLGDRIRMNAINNDRVYMRSLATRQSNLALSRYVKDTVNILKAGGYDLIILRPQV